MFSGLEFEILAIRALVEAEISKLSNEIQRLDECLKPHRSNEK
jgi:hypothetical protein